MKKVILGKKKIKYITIGELSKLIGFESAHILSIQFRNLSIPEKRKDTILTKVITNLIGDDKYIILIKNYGGRRIAIQRCSVFQKEMKNVYLTNELIRELAEKNYKEAVAEVSRLNNVSELEVADAICRIDGIDDFVSYE